MLTLARGGDSLTVAPECGGAIVSWSRASRDMLRRALPDAVRGGDPGAMGCFPLVPYGNRIASRRFVWAGKTHELAPNFGDHPHTIHGVGWKTPWAIDVAAADHVTLSLSHDPSPHWPFAFTARLTYRLTSLGLTIEMEASNRHDDLAPMGLGIHPYFPRTPGATLGFDGGGVWLADETALPSDHISIPPSWSHTKGRSVDDEPLDNCFTSWSGLAILPGMRIEADPIFGNLQVYTPTGADFFCVEPVTHVPDAINGTLPAGQAMGVLAPGETSHGAIRLIPTVAG